MSMLNFYKTNDMLLPDATFDEIYEDLDARNEWNNKSSNGWTFYGESDVFPQYAMHEEAIYYEDSTYNSVDYFE